MQVVPVSCLRLVAVGTWGLATLFSRMGLVGLVSAGNLLNGPFRKECGSSINATMLGAEAKEALWSRLTIGFRVRTFSSEVIT